MKRFQEIPKTISDTQAFKLDCLIVKVFSLLESFNTFFDKYIDLIDFTFSVLKAIEKYFFVWLKIASKIRNWHYRVERKINFPSAITYISVNLSWILSDCNAWSNYLSIDSSITLNINIILKLWNIYNFFCDSVSKHFVTRKLRIGHKLKESCV